MLDNKWAAGRRAKQRGTGFEGWLEKAFGRIGWDIIRIEDGCKKHGLGGKQLLPAKQPFDFIAFGPNKRILFFDAKVRSNTKKITPSMFKVYDTKKAKSLENQIENLQMIRHRGHEAGFLVYLIDVDEIHWLPIENLESCESVLIGKYSLLGLNL